MRSEHKCNSFFPYSPADTFGSDGWLLEDPPLPDYTFSFGTSATSERNQPDEERGSEGARPNCNH